MSVDTVYQEHQRVVLTDDIDEKRLKAGDVGAVVHIYPGSEAYVVEFLTLDGYTEAIVHVRASQIRPVSKSDITHAREIDVAV